MMNLSRSSLPALQWPAQWQKPTPGTAAPDPSTSLLPTGAVTAKHAGRSPVLGAAVAWLGIFAPGVLMMFALLPWWSVFRRWPLYRR